MSQFEPSRILNSSQDNLDKENVQQYVEIGANTYLGTKDGIKYTLLSMPDNKFKLCEIPNDDNLNLADSWSESYEDDLKSQNLLTPSNSYKSYKLITVKKDSFTPCRGQGDESGNSPLFITPDSTSKFLKNADDPEKNLFENISPDSSLTYTTLQPRHELVNNLDAAAYMIPGTIFQIPTAPVVRGALKAGRYAKSRFVPPPSPYVSPIPTYQRGRGHRQRRPRNVYYQYRTPVLHSTPNSSSSSSSLSGHSSSSPTSLLTSMDCVASSSMTDPSIELPRVPNNTPNSSFESSAEHNEPQVLNVQWMPQIQASIEDYINMDARECHNEKERKRRLRIKMACQQMKGLLPCVCNKTDNATIFENAVHFIAFMRETVGSTYDMEFLEQTCMY